MGIPAVAVYSNDWPRIEACLSAIGCRFSEIVDRRPETSGVAVSAHCEIHGEKWALMLCWHPESWILAFQPNSTPFLRPSTADTDMIAALIEAGVARPQ